jgi:NADH:ubiquinone reductase (H+-translocating)
MMSGAETSELSVVIVGGGFAGVGCAKELAKHDVAVTLIDRNNYHQFQPLLYQVATAELATTDIARPLRGIFGKDRTVAVKQLTVTDVDPGTRTVTTGDGQTFTGDYLVLAAGSRPNFFHTPGAEQHALPLYTVDHAKALRTRLIEVFEAADADPARIDQGALNIVIVGAGPTGVETAGAVADLVNQVIPKAFHGLDVKRTRIYLIDHGPVVLAAFSDESARSPVSSSGGAWPSRRTCSPRAWRCPTRRPRRAPWRRSWSLPSASS